jgi:hypothetical protein
VVVGGGWSVKVFRIIPTGLDLEYVIHSAQICSVKIHMNIDHIDF